MLPLFLYRVIPADQDQRGLEVPKATQEDKVNKDCPEQVEPR